MGRKRVEPATTVRDGEWLTGCPNHCHGSGEEARLDPFQSRKVEAYVPEERVYLCRTSISQTMIVKGLSYKNIKDRNKDNECKGVEIGEDVVGETVSAHRCRLRGEIVVQLVICQPYYQFSIPSIGG